MINRTKISTFAENYRGCVKDGEAANFAEWVKLSAESDPNFLSWLFDDDSLQDFSAGDHLEEWDEFLKECETCDPFDM